jgi:hypothetical protein
MREGDEISINKKKLMREMNQYNADMNLPKRWSPEEIDTNFSEKTAKTLISGTTFTDMYEDNVTKPDNIGKVGSIRLGRELGRTKKSTKSKSKRVKKSTRCKCK